MDDKIRIYIAGAWEAKPRLKPIRDTINVLPEGFEVTSSWLNETGINPEGPSVVVQGEEARALYLAKRDVRDLLHSDMLILDTLETNTRGGKDFESGMAHALGMEWWIVGPARNVFHQLATLRLDDWDAAIRALQSLDQLVYPETDDSHLFDASWSGDGTR